MSYDIKLVDPVTKNVLILEEPHHMRGGTYAIGGTTKAHLNVTYNYCHIFRTALQSDDGIRAIYGLTGAESIPILVAAASTLSDDIDDDYWAPTEGNAKQALLQLLTLAAMLPNGVWDGD